jgi:hypothetical protein
MAEYQITSWRELPSLVVAREADTLAKVQLPHRFQEAIDEAAMRLGDVSSDDYLAGWERGPWITGTGAPADLATSVVEQLEASWPTEVVTAFLDRLGPAVSGD